MGEHQIFLAEKKQIDELVERGFQITKADENLSGAFVYFKKQRQDQREPEPAMLHLRTPEARKYFTNLLGSTAAEAQGG